MLEKNILKKSFLLLMIGLFAATVLYPFLHEFGHILALKFFGGQVANISLFPTQAITCGTRDISATGQIIIGLFGAFFPIIVSLILKPKRITTKYLTVFLKTINIICLSANTVFAFFYKIGMPISDNDITTVLDIKPSLFSHIVTLNTVFMIFLLISIRKDCPLTVIYEFVFLQKQANR